MMLGMALSTFESDQEPLSTGAVSRSRVFRRGWPLTVDASLLTDAILLHDSLDVPIVAHGLEGLNPVIGRLFVNTR